MTYFRTIIHSILFISLLGLAACNNAAMNTSATKISAQLTASSVVPPTTSTATGEVDAYLDEKTNKFSWTIKYAGLTGAATAAHFHGPALVGENAGPALPIVGSLASPIKGEAVLTNEQKADLLASKWYLNVHTAANPDGEIRGQVVVKP